MGTKQTPKKAEWCRPTMLTTSFLVHSDPTLNAGPSVTGWWGNSFFVSFSSLSPASGGKWGCRSLGMIFDAVFFAYVDHFHTALLILVGLLLLLEQLRVDAVIGVVVTALAKIHHAI